MSSIAKNGPRTLHPGGHMRSFFDNPLSMLIESPQHGDVVRWRFGPLRVLVANSPDMIHDVLVSNAAAYEKSATTKDVMKPLLGLACSSMMATIGRNSANWSPQLFITNASPPTLT